MRRLLAGVFLIIVFLNACEQPQGNHHPFQNFSLQQLEPWQAQAWKPSNHKIRLHIDSFRLHERDTTFVDISCNKYYAARSPYLWINHLGTDLRADTLLLWFQMVDSTGVPSSRVYAEIIRDNLQRLRNGQFDNHYTASRTLASLEYYLTKAFLRYCTGQRFGFANPQKILNRLEYEDNNGPNRYFRQLFDIPMETPDEPFIAQCFKAVSSYQVEDFLQSVQPQDDLYRRLADYYHTTTLSSAQKRTVALNIERSRWRIKDQRPHRWVSINIPSQQLVAYDQSSDSLLTMKVCYGSRGHKSPLLISRMGWLELNPYWIIPHSIVRREIVPRHLNDTDYFNRNRYKIIDKSTGEIVSPLDVDESMLLSGQYRIRQDKGNDNSLGRMIFRFPNNFSIYLHDTNNKAAFGRASRALSHGCIRLEKPMALAMFLLREKDDKFLDRLREAVENPLEDLDDNSPKQQNMMTRCSFDTPIGVYINYFTCYPAPKGSHMEFFPDVYGYDAILAKHLLH